MTRRQKEKLVARIFTFIVVFSVLLVWLPYVAIVMAIYIAIQVAKKI